MITPRTKFVTVGGCIASDVHGKAHHVQGSFSTCLDSMTVLLANREIVVASRGENADLFFATVGGMGLLGIVLSTKIRLRRIERTYFWQRSLPVKNLEEMQNRCYGRRGFTQYQFVIPFANAERNLRELLTVILSAGELPFLDILKRLGKESGGLLSFPREGYTLAIDFPIRCNTCRSCGDSIGWCSRPEGECTLQRIRTSKSTCFERCTRRPSAGLRARPSTIPMGSLTRT